MKDSLILTLDKQGDKAKEDNLILTLGQSTALTLTIPNGSGGSTNVIMDTTSNWAQRAQYVPRRTTIIVYSDRYVIEGVNYPGIKIGDGITTVGNLPFVGTENYEELENLPSINGITLIGNRTFSEFFADGIIIDGGYANGFTQTSMSNESSDTEEG